MSWEREPLFIKSKLFFEKGFEEEKESPFFGLWCAMGLELLARSSISHVSPSLLAEPDASHQNLLHALNLGSGKSKKKSLITIQVLTLCQLLITDFTEYHFKIASSIINQRNEELHSGGAAFLDYPTSLWIAGFYKCCKILTEFQGESLNSLLGDEIEKEASVILSEIEDEVHSKTQNLIAAHRKVFENKLDDDRKNLIDISKDNSEKLAYKGHHKVYCPACKSLATIIGEPYGKDNIQTKEDRVIVKQSILPTKFHCIACELKINGYSALTSAKISNHYTRTTSYKPEAYFDMIRADDYETISRKYHEYGMDMEIQDFDDYMDDYMEEYNNE